MNLTITFLEALRCIAQQHVLGDAQRLFPDVQIPSQIQSKKRAASYIKEADAGLEKSTRDDEVQKVPQSRVLQRGE